MQIRYAVSVLMRDVLVLFQPTSKRVLLIFILAGVILTSGCLRLFNVDSKEREMEIVARLLQEKYGEEFTIHNTWGDVGYSYIAVCSPVAEPGIVFESVFYIGGEGKLYKDEYPQGIVAWELEQLLQPEVRKISEDAYIKAFPFYAETAFTRREDVTIESYLEAIGSDDNASQRIYFEVYANIGNIKSIDYEEVYSVLKEISTSIAPSSGSIGLYYIKMEDIDLCREYFKRNSDLYSEIKHILADYEEYGTGITAGEIKESFDQFKSEMEVIVNGNIEGNGSNGS